jgi:hypothetical protein
MAMQNNGVPDGSQHESAPSDVPSSVESPRPEPELPRWATRATNNAPMRDTRLAAFIGPRWEKTYRAKLARFVDDPAFTPTWNWAAALGAPWWFLYRKLYLAFLVFTLLPSVALPYLTGSDKPITPTVDTPEGRTMAMMMVAVVFSTVIAAGGTANWLLFRRARAATTVVSMQQLPDDASLSLLRRIGGVNPVPTAAVFVVWMALQLAAVASMAK